MSEVLTRRSLDASVRRALQTDRILDIHTHLLAPQFDNRLAWGIDELLTSHDIVTEYFRVAGWEADYDKFWSLPKKEQADLVWDRLFVRRTPISEACRGVVTSLRALGCDPAEGDLYMHRRYFSSITLDEHVDNVLDLSGVRRLVMCNDPLDPKQRAVFTSDISVDNRFKTTIWLDGLLNPTDESLTELSNMGYSIAPDLSGDSYDQVRRFLDDWIGHIRPLYIGAPLEPSFRFPGESNSARLLERCILPTAEQHGLPIALMIGMKHAVNPKLRQAGNAVARADITAIANICSAYPNARILATALGRENQHELTVIARKFRNLFLFGCWRYVSGPSLSEEITRMRIELLGHSFLPKHSGACVLEQLISRWHDARQMLAKVLTDKYEALIEAGWSLTEDEIVRDVTDLLGGSALRFVRGKKSL